MLSTLQSVQVPGGQDVEVKVESSDSSDTTVFTIDINTHTYILHAN